MLKRSPPPWRAAIPLLAVTLAAGCSNQPVGDDDDSPTGATGTPAQTQIPTPTATATAPELTPSSSETTPAVTPTAGPATDTPTREPTAPPTEPPTPTAEPTPEPTPIPVGGSTTWVGASWKTLLPVVNGTTEYFDGLRADPLALTPGDPGDNPGVFVRQWDVGTIGIGNGYPSSHWVHDEIRATAVAFQDRTRADLATVVLVGADIYMLFANDLEAVHEKVRTSLGEEGYARLHLLISATHNHEGPDTAGLEQPINHDYYDYLTTQLAAAVVDAVGDLQPADLKANSSAWQFGLGDTYAPRIVDPTLNTLQATRVETGEPIATVVQWSNHPEAVLFYDGPGGSPQQCAYLQGVDEAYEYEDDGDPDTYTCSFEGQFISADFPGVMAWEIMEATGAPALYLNGTVGSLMSPLRVDVWEVQGEGGQPVGDGITVPEGATVVPRNFRKMAIIGQELARKVLGDLDAAEPMTTAGVEFATQSYFTKLSNVAFRIGMSPRPRSDDLPILLGNTLRDLYTCDPTGASCVSDEYATQLDPILGVPMRVGDHLKTTVHRIRIGDIGLLSIPGEMAPELSEGLPADFYTNNSAYYPREGDAETHTSGEDYEIRGYIRAALDEPFKWVVGLGGDELGYMVPLSDYRVWCVADEDNFAEIGITCAELYDQGVIAYPQGVDGARCQEIDGNPAALAGLTQPQRQGLSRSCQYGLTFGEVPNHYPETNSVGWGHVGDYLEAVRTLTAYGDPWPTINPAFYGVNFESANP